MSPRAALRLQTLGFRDVYDYVPGKVDWLAHGLPSEGASAGHPTAADLVHDDVPGCRLDDSLETVAHKIGASDYGFAVVLGEDDVLLGRVRKSATDRAGETVEAVMEPGPSTIRPHMAAADLRKQMDDRDLKTMLVTTPEGRWIGAIRREDVDAAGHPTEQLRLHSGNRRREASCRSLPGGARPPGAERLFSPAQGGFTQILLQPPLLGRHTHL